MWARVRDVVMVLCATALAAQANGFRNPPESASALGRDGGKLTQAGDPSAVAVNPANVADAKAVEVQGSLTLIHTETDYTSPLGSATTEDPWKALPNAFAVIPAPELDLVVGVGITTPFGQSTVWDEDSIFRYTAPYYAELTVVDLNPTVSFRASERVAIGVGLDVYSSTLDIRQAFPWSAVVGAPAPDGKIKFEGDGTGLGWNLGVLVDLCEKQRIAATYRSAVTVEYEGDTTLTGIPAPGLGKKSSDFESEIEFPSIVAVGYGIDLTEDLTVGVDVEWIEFSTFDQLPLDAGVNSALLPAPAIPQDWDDTWTYGAGATWRATDECSLYASYKYMESPIPDETLAPTLPDADRHIVSIGGGYHSGAHRLDLAYAYSIFDDRDVSSNINPAYNGSYDLSSHLIAVSYGYSF